MTQLSRSGVIRVIRRAGLAAAADALALELPETVDLDRARDLLARHGVTHDDLISRLGGSP